MSKLKGRRDRFVMNEKIKDQSICSIKTENESDWVYGTNIALAFHFPS